MGVSGLLAISGIVLSGVATGEGTEEVPTTLAPTTATVQQQDLEESHDFEGVVSYADPADVWAAADGYLTYLAKEGVVLERGDLVYTVASEPSSVDVAAANERVAAAEAQLAGSEAQRVQMNSGPVQSEQASAEAAVAQAQKMLDDLKAPPSEAELTAAQAELTAAEDAYRDLFDRPDDAELATLNQEVTRAESNLETARNSQELAWIDLVSAQNLYCALDPVPVTDVCTTDDLPLTDSDTGELVEAAEEAADSGDGATADTIRTFIAADSAYQRTVAEVADATAALAAANAALTDATDGPEDWEREQALAAVYQAREQLTRLQQGPSTLELTQAEADLASAQAHLDELLTGATPEQRQESAAAVQAARKTLETAQLQLAELATGPRPVVLFYGTAPVWRRLSLGVEPGPDVKALEEDLAALGFDAQGQMVVDDVYDQATADAVTAWQTSIGAEADGEVEVGDVVYAPGPVQMGAPVTGVEIGMIVTVGGPITELTPIARQVMTTDGETTLESTLWVLAEVSVNDADLFSPDDEVVVQLDDGSTFGGVVESVGEPKPSDSGSVVDVTIRPTETIDSSWEGNTVTLTATKYVARDVLTVPVSALLALLEGGYGVEVVQSDGSTHLVPVELGKVVDAQAEITGEVESGDLVVVP
ncbi:MAG TPA: peptidoglycan-binding protein [Acidimicrobiia bacterium]|nr:peptidoglycan-binding protein [Acidimicrobiia bacterium]